MNQNASSSSTSSSSSTASTSTASKKSDFKSAKNFVSLSDILNKTNTLSRNDSLRANASTLRDEKKVEVPALEAKITQPTTSLDPSKPSLVFDFLTVQALFKELELDCDEQIKKLDENEKSRKQIALKQKKILDEIRLKWVQSPESYKLAKSVRLIKCSCFSMRIGAKRKRQRRYKSYEKKFYKFYNSKLCALNRQHFANAKTSRVVLTLLVMSRSFLVVKTDRRRLKTTTQTVFTSRTPFKGSWSRVIDIKEFSKIFRNKSIDELTKRRSPIQLRSKKPKKSSRPSTRILASQLPVIKMNSETSSEENSSKTLLDKLYERYCDQTVIKPDEASNFKEPPALNISGNDESMTSSSSSASPPPSSSTLLIRRKTKKYNNSNNLTMPLVNPLTSEESQNVSLEFQID